MKELQVKKAKVLSEMKVRHQEMKNHVRKQEEQINKNYESINKELDFDSLFNEIDNL